MSSDFKCEACKAKTDRLHMRDSDGKWVCFPCVPKKEVAACPGLKERMELRRRRVAQASLNFSKGGSPS
jgi:ribosomal protein L37AE/L43A